VPKFSSLHPGETDVSAPKDEVVMKHIDIDDDPMEDILYHLKDACDWIEAGLQSGSKNGDDHDWKQIGVLVHCTQGISRSGSIVVAYCKTAPNRFHQDLSVYPVIPVPFLTAALVYLPQ
jgi:protein-tyrosine phosphatase